MTSTPSSSSVFNRISAPAMVTSIDSAGALSPDFLRLSAAAADFAIRLYPYLYITHWPDPLPACHPASRPHKKTHGAGFETAIHARHIYRGAITKKSVMIASFQTAGQPFLANK